MNLTKHVRRVLGVGLILFGIGIEVEEELVYRAIRFSDFLPWTGLHHEWTAVVFAVVGVWELVHR